MLKVAFKSISLQIFVKENRQFVKNSFQKPKLAKLRYRDPGYRKAD
jgi:hypothetical protein